jgi:very-short-patch-repair endonuclease
LIRTIIPYSPKLKEYARYLRNHSTKSEIILWYYLKGKQRLGFDFHRQKPLDNYIVDFFCSELNLIIEIDGISHDFKHDKDFQRQRILESYGLKFLRFSDDAVKNDVEGVVKSIDLFIEKIQHTP